jgi:hypothetical protein
VIMATPLTAAEIVWGKWWGTFAMIPRLAILPIWVASGAAIVTDGGMGLVLLIGLILAYAAAITSLGLALATWVTRLGRVITVSVIAFVVVTVLWPLLLAALPMLPTFRSMDFDPSSLDGFYLASPFFGIYATTDWACRLRFAYAEENPTWPLFWIVAYSAIAAILALATWRNFDACLGRVTATRPGGPWEHGVR